MNRAIALLTILLLTAAAVSSSHAAPTVWDTPTISSDTTWSGDIVIRQNVVVSPGATLRVAAGTNARPGDTLVIHGQDGSKLLVGGAPQSSN